MSRSEPTCLQFFTSAGKVRKRRIGFEPEAHQANSSMTLIPAGCRDAGEGSRYAIKGEADSPGLGPVAEERTDFDAFRKRPNGFPNNLLAGAMLLLITTARCSQSYWPGAKALESVMFWWQTRQDCRAEPLSDETRAYESW